MLTIEDLKFDPPQFSISRLQRIAETHFGIGGLIKPLEGERDQNCRITTLQGRQYILKISTATEDLEVVDFQIKALMHIADTDPGIPVPRMVRGRDGGLVYHESSPQGRHQVRLLTYLPGILYQDGPEPSCAGLYQVGEFLGRLNLALLGFSHPAAGHFMPWDSTNGLIFERQLCDQFSPEVKTLVADSMHRLQHEVYPLVPDLRSQVIHHDGHGANLLRSSAELDTVVGVIDFGDMIFGPVICDLAVSLTHFIETAAEPTKVAAAMCSGFHSVFPLQLMETETLLDWVIARQILILQLFEFRRRNMEHPPQFVTTDQPGIIASLQRLTRLDRAAFNRALKEAIA